jgi:peptidoglycan/LPS O-acetylase OafA/YrhL
MTENLARSDGLAAPGVPARARWLLARNESVTLQDALLARGRGNSLNLIRLMLASMVIVAHAWPLSGSGDTAAWFEPFAWQAVPGFFCLSGFLIARSRMTLGLGRFMWHRCLRILPAYYVVLLVVAFVAAPLSTLAGGVWQADEAVSYVVGNSAVRQLVWSIPGTVDGMAWNGSLWTLFYELLAYVCAGLLLTVPLARRHARTVTPLLLACCAVGVWWRIEPGAVDTSLVLETIRLGTYFLAGMVFYFWADRTRLDWRLAVVALGLVAAAWAVGRPDVLGPLPLAYFLLWLGATVPARWAQRNDVSYGVYIYAFPVAVLVEWFMPGLSVFQHFCCVVLFTVPLAWTSWLVVERPAMRHKNARRRRPEAPPEQVLVGEPGASAA